MPALLPHPASAPHAQALAIDVDWRWVAGHVLELEYRILGDATVLRLPLAAVAAERRDGLWRHSCAELFVAEPGQAAYREFNFSPSGHWAAYEFDDYRSGMRAHEWVGAPPRCTLAGNPSRSSAARGGLVFAVALERVALPAARRLLVGPTMVLEALDGSHSFWALRHAAANPDFHHPDGRCAELEVPS